MDIVAECRSGYATIMTRIPKLCIQTSNVCQNVTRVEYTVMKRILIDIQRSYADLISYVYTMYPYPQLSGVCIPVVPKTAYATIADQFRVISMQYTTPHTVCLRAVSAGCTRQSSQRGLAQRRRTTTRYRRNKKS